MAREAWRDRQAHEWKGPRAFRAWLLAIAKNRIRDAVDRAQAHKRGGGRRTEPFSVLEGGEEHRSPAASIPAGSTTPSRVAAQRERAEAMRAALETLPDVLRDVLWLRLFEQRAMRAVAEELGIGLSTAKERFLRGAALYRKRLRHTLGSALSSEWVEP